MSSAVSSSRRQFQQAFFSEVENFLDVLIKILPEEAADLTVYRAVARKTTRSSDREWFIDCFFHYAFPYRKKIEAKDVSFFKYNADEIVNSHIDDTQYKGEAIAWFEKFKELVNSGKVSPEYEEWAMNYMNIFLKLSIREKSLRST